MQQIIAITRKEFLLMAQKPGSWFIVFIVPLIFIWIMQAVFGSSGTPVVTVFAVDEDRTQASKRVMDALRVADNIKIEELKTRDEADQRVGAGERMAAIIIPDGFGQTLTTPDGSKVQLLIDPARSEQANIVIGLVNAALGPIMVDAEVSRGVEAGVGQLLINLNASATGTPEAGITPQPTLQNTPRATLQSSAQRTIVPARTPAATPQTGGLNTNPQPGGQNSADNSDALRKFLTAAIKGVVSSQVQDAMDNPQVQMDVQAYQADKKAAVHRPSLLDSLVPGYSLMFVFFLISNLAGTVIEERQTGTLRRLLVAPVPRSRILLGKMVPFFLIAVLQFFIVLGVSKVAFGIDLGHSLLALAILILTSSLAMVSLGILIAAMARTEGQADGLAIVIVLAMAVVSGAMFPSISIPGIQLITPHYWALQGFLNVISRGMGVSGVLTSAGVLITMSAVFFTIGAVRFRFE